MSKLHLRIAVPLAVLLLTPSAMAQERNVETLAVEDIVALTEVGLGDEAIIAKINAENATFRLSTDEMIELSNRGVSSAVIAAMLVVREAPEQEMSLTSPDPMVPHPAGMYLLAGDNDAAQMRRMNPTVSSQAKTGGILGNILTAGIASASVKVAFEDEEADLQTSAEPVFYIFFDQATDPTAGGTWANGANTVVSSPAEFTLVELRQKEGRREARVGSFNIAGAKSGVMDRDRIPFDYEMVRQGVFMITPTESLEPGEYGFIFPLAGAGTTGAMTARVFDFSVRAVVGELEAS